MEVIEDGNIMDRIPILLARDFEYYETNQTVLSETVCPGVVGGRLDFPRTASFAAVKIVIWLEEEFSIAFKRGSGMFVQTEEDDKGDVGVAKTSDPDKFVQLAIKSADMLLEHLHILAQEALDHADLPVLTATLGAAALLRNALHCFVQIIEDSGNSERHSLISACYKRYVTMSEAVAERVLDLHNRVLSLYVLQGACQGNRTTNSGDPLIHGWWLYMQGTKKDLWDTVPPRIAQRIFAGMLNETLTILTVRYCQEDTSESDTPLLINNIMNILLCSSRLLPSICSSGSDLVGLQVSALTRDVRDVHAKCNELFKSMVFRGAELHYLYQAFNDEDELTKEVVKDCPYPWFTFVNPKMFEVFDDITVKTTQELPKTTAIGLELRVLLAQPQPSWSLLVKVLMMRDCHLSRTLLTDAIRHMGIDNTKWPSSGLWYSANGKPGNCKGFLCTADGFCKFKEGSDQEELARTAGALTYVLATIGNKQEVKSTLLYALELSGKDWSACLDKRQVWCDRRPPWLAAILSMIGSTLEFIPEILVKAIKSGASMYQTMSVCLSSVGRVLPTLPTAVHMISRAIQSALPSEASPVGRSVLLQLLLTTLYEELLLWAEMQAEVERNDSNGEPYTMSQGKRNKKQVRILTRGHTNTSTSLSFDGSHSSCSSIALAIAEALCCIDEDDKHAEEIAQLIAQSEQAFTLSNLFGLEDFPEFAGFVEEGTVPGSNAEHSNVANCLTTQLLMTPPGRDSLRVIYNHLQKHEDEIYKALGIEEETTSTHDLIPLNKAPLLYQMFHIGRRPFDEYLRNEWPMPWSRLAKIAKLWSGVEGSRTHVMRRCDMKSYKNTNKTSNCTLKLLYDMFKAPSHSGL